MAKKEDDFYLVKFDPPYNFEGTEYKELDLSGIKDLSGKDLREADMEFMESGQRTLAKEMSAGYAFIIAGRAIKKPALFFDDMPIIKANEVVAIVSSFLLDVVSIVEKARR